MIRFRRFALTALAAVAVAGWMSVERASAAEGNNGPKASDSPSDKPAVEKLLPEEPAPQAIRQGCAACKPCDCCCRRCRVRARRSACCCSAATTTAAAAPKADPAVWKDLFDGKSLKNWTATDFGGQGKVEVKDGTIVMEMGNDMTGITWAGGELPRDNYELSLEGMRLQGGDFFCSTTFPVGKDPCTLVVGGWGGTVVGLSTVDGYNASDNQTTNFQTFKDNQWYKVRIRVSTAKIDAFVDGDKVVTQEREGHKFDIDFRCEPSKPLGIGTWCTTGAVRNIRIRQLTPEEVKLAAEEK